MTRYGLHGSIRATPGPVTSSPRCCSRPADAGQAGNGGPLLSGKPQRRRSELVWVTEVWTDRDVHAASLQDPATITMIARPPITAGFGDHSELVPVGGAGSTL